MPEQSLITLEEVKSLRRHFHRYPELSFQEYKTQEFIYSYCKNLSCQIEKIKTGIMLYFGLNKLSTIAFRAEMDALPIKEKANVEYTSNNEGVMHACGHDGHMAMLLLLAKFIHSHQEQLHNNYLLIFQPSEEVYGGSNLIIESEFFNKHLPKYIFSLHVFPTLKEGLIFYHEGPFLAMCCEIDIFIQGKAAHIYSLSEGIDANRIANLLMNKLYDYFDKLNQDNTRFLIGKINGGTQRNIVSESCSLHITLRNFNQKDYLKQKKEIMEMITQTEKSFNCQIKINFNDDFAPVINDKRLIELVKKHYDIKLTSRKIIGDDFAQYHTKCLTGYFLLGINSSFLHSANFSFDEKVLLNGLNFYQSILNI